MSATKGKSTIEIDMNYPPGVDVLYWDTSNGKFGEWKEGIVGQRVTEESLSGDYRVKWCIIKKKDYSISNPVHAHISDPTHLRLSDTKNNENMKEAFLFVRRLDMERNLG